VNDLTDSTTGNTVYNSSTEQLGDGNQNADLNDVLLEDILDAVSGNTVYDSSSETLGDGNQDANLNSLLSSISVLDLIDANSGNTIYDESTETVGDGNQSVNVRDVTLQDIIDTASGKTVYDSSTETIGDGTQTVDAGSVNTESLVIGGTLYEEDDNSPIDASNTASVTHQMADDSDEVIIIPEKGFESFMDGLRVNGDSGDNYSTTDSSDSQQTGLTEFQYKSFHGWQYLVLHSNTGDRIAYGGVYADEFTGVGLRGHNDAVTPPISQFTILRRDGTQLDAKARVFRRVMNI